MGAHVREIVRQLWPEIDWIENLELREQVTQVWIKALERSPLQPEDLKQIPFHAAGSELPDHVHGT